MDDENGALNSSLPYVATRYRAAALEAVLSTKIYRLKNPSRGLHKCISAFLFQGLID